MRVDLKARPHKVSTVKYTVCVTSAVVQVSSPLLKQFNDMTQFVRIVSSRNPSSAKKRHFHVSPPTFLFPLERPLRLSRNILHGWKDNSMVAKPLAACTYLSSIVSELYDA